MMVVWKLLSAVSAKEVEHDGRYDGRDRHWP